MKTVQYVIYHNFCGHTHTELFEDPTGRPTRERCYWGRHEEGLGWVDDVVKAIGFTNITDLEQVVNEISRLRECKVPLSVEVIIR